MLLDRPVQPLLQHLAAEGVLGGLDLSIDYPELGPALLVCATETRTSADLERCAQAFERALQQAQAA